MILEPELRDQETDTVDDEIAAVVDALEERALVVINDDDRTWRVTDIVDRDLSKKDDKRLQRRAVRLEASGDDPDTAALVCDQYPSRYEAGLHPLSSRNFVEEGRVYAVTSIDRLDLEPEWIVHRKEGTPDSYHLPDPQAAARGDALPACDAHKAARDEPEYRFAARSLVDVHQDICRDCARRFQPRDLPRLTCPSCGCTVGNGVVYGPRVDVLDTFTFNCPRCPFDDTIQLDESC